MTHLQSVIPPHEPDVVRLHRMLGRAHEYLEHLKEELHRRAQEANDLHNRLQALEKESVILRQRVQDLEAELRQYTTKPAHSGGS